MTDKPSLLEKVSLERAFVAKQIQVVKQTPGLQDRSTTISFESFKKKDPEKVSFTGTAPELIKQLIQHDFALRHTQ